MRCPCGARRDPKKGYGRHCSQRCYRAYYEKELRRLNKVMPVARFGAPVRPGQYNHRTIQRLAVEKVIRYVNEGKFNGILSW